MKRLSSLIQETKDKVRRGAKIGAFVSLGALASGGCTAPGISSLGKCEIVTCNSWIDKDGDDWVDMDEITKKDQFHEHEHITIITFFKKYKGAETKYELLEPSGKIVTSETKIIPADDCFHLEEFKILREKNPSGTYTITTLINDIPKASKEFYIY